MPKEVRNIITPQSRTPANEFETMEQAILAGVVWDKTKNKALINYYYDKIMKA